jgi:hypothetical protein
MFVFVHPIERLRTTAPHKTSYIHFNVLNISSLH